MPLFTSLLNRPPFASCICQQRFSSVCFEARNWWTGKLETREVMSERTCLRVWHESVHRKGVYVNPLRSWCVIGCRCSGCVLDVGLDKPPVLTDATRFFGRYGVRDFELDTGDVVSCILSVAKQNAVQTNFKRNLSSAEFLYSFALGLP